MLEQRTIYKLMTRAEMTAKTGSRLSRGRLILLGFGAAAVALIVSPLAVQWWAMRDACPRETMSEGYFKDGMYWRITRADCGSAIGIVWQVHVGPGDGQPRLAFNAQNAPKPDQKIL